MAAENHRSSLAGEKDGAGADRFPIGMRVLAVDDDPICLKILDNLLQQCQYKATLTNQASKALQILREKKTKYDIVISDVNMPDMDGFNLLELVGLELDLPVIMMSSYSDTDLVMKGVIHGACDYLLKPIRIEELKNIWQHVVRKRKQEKKALQENPQSGSIESGYQAAGNSSDNNGKNARKRKDDEDEDEEEGNENEESSNQKKPRVVWSVELHKKFVAAVNQLGLDKAVPKKILDLMNVEGLTRENVASHLQKYRLYLKRINVPNQPGMVGPMGGQDISYMPMGTGPASGFGDFRTFAGGSSRLSSPSISSYPPGGMLGRLNSTAGLAIRGIASSNMTQQPGHQQTLSNSFNPLMRPNQAMLPNTRPTMQPGDFNQINNPVAFNPPAAFSCAPSNPLMIQGADNRQQVLNKAAFGGPSSLGAINMDSFDPNAVQLPKFPSSSSLQLTDALEDPRGNMQGQTGQMGNVFQNMNYGAADYNSTASNHFSGMNSLVSGASGMGPFAPNVEQSGANKPVMDSSFSDQINSGAVPFVPQHPVMERQDGFIPNNIESLDDIMSAIMKRDQNENVGMDGELGFDNYNFM